jgi:phosphoglycerol transferase MdoB-like AlkP superfamily enzyme
MLVREILAIAVYGAVAVLVWGVLRLEIHSHYLYIANGCFILALLTSITFVFRTPISLVIGLVVLLALYAALSAINELKIAAVTYPLTLLDFRMFVANPHGLFLSLGASPAVYVGSSVLLALLLGGAAYLVGKCFGKLQVGSTVCVVGRASIAVTVLALLSAPALHSMQRFMEDKQRVLMLWEDDGLVRFSRAVGIFSFLMYSGFVENQEKNYFFSYDPSEPPASEKVVGKSVANLFVTDRINAGVLPNIIMIHAESTFDPNDVFDLSAPARNALYYVNQGTSSRPQVHFHGPVLANTIGGGSWISEFEVLLGLDSRLFGVAGQYTHASLSAYARNTFPRYLRSRGYQVSGYTIEDGSFYNARRAYLSYGFQNYYASSELGFTPIDSEIMEKALAVPSENKAAPFMKFVLLHENHAPHPCSDPRRKRETTFRGESSDMQNCVLNEYLERARSTERAVDIAESFLQQEEKRTGRPYVLAVYGDHQPHSFTSTGGQRYSLGIKLEEYRRDTTKRKTVFQLISSKPNVFRCCWKHPIPMTMVPTLVSAYLASSPDELYLPENVYQFDKCGSDWIGRLVEANFYIQESQASAKIKCSEFESLLAGYKKRDVLGDGRKFVEQIASLSVHSEELSGPVCAPQIAVTASGTAFKEPPAFKIYLDGELLGESVIDNAPDNSMSVVSEQQILARAKVYKFSAGVDHRPGLFELEFYNDDWAGPGSSGDTNLWVKSIRIDDLIFKGTDVTIDPSIVKAEKRRDWVVLWSSGKVSLKLGMNDVKNCL